MRRSLRIGWGSTLLLAVLLLPSIARGVVLENARMRLVVDDATGRIVELRAPGAPVNIVDVAVEGPLWRIGLAPPGPASLTPADAGAFSLERVDAGLRMIWSAFQLEAAREMRVVVDARLDDVSGATCWSIALEGLGPLRLLSVAFPRIGGLTRQEHEALAVPVWMGEKMANPRERLNASGQARRFAWKYPGILSMQCLTVYAQDGPGLYAACNDTEGHGKDFAVFGDGMVGMGFEVVQYPERKYPAYDNYRAPYEVQLAPHAGDWFSAAQRYRAWALQQGWTERSRLTTGTTPGWCIDTGLWVWNRDRSENVLPPAAVLQEAAGVPVGVFWHWWHGCAYDAGFPEYLPPREGADHFKEALSQAHDLGLHAIVYMNQRLWGMETESWETKNAARYAVKRPDGEIQPEVYNTFTKSPCAAMCMGTEFWRDTYAGLATEAVLGLGVDGIYMDQACSSLACYDPGHGHPIGGGTYWIKGFQSLQANIRARTANGGRTVTLAGEGCGEAWLPHLDLMLSLQVSMERYHTPGDWEPIPFFHAVYHGYFIPYGNYASLTMPPYDSLWPEEFAPEEPLALLDRKYAQQFRLEQARAFAWGQVPTVANFRPEHLTSRKEEMNFVIRLARLRQRAKEFLLHGTMLRPPDMDVPEKEIPISRLSIYAGQQGALSEYTAEHPVLITSAWRSHPHAEALVVVNIDEDTQRVAFTVDGPAPGALRILEDDGSERLKNYQDAMTIDEPIAGTSARIYVWRERSKAPQTE